jgi:uncharacterized protein (TIGR02284 family)
LIKLRTRLFQDHAARKHVRSERAGRNRHARSEPCNFLLMPNPAHAMDRSLDMADLVHSLKSLHTSLIDARSGYQEGLEDAHGKGLGPLFSELSAMHAAHAAVIAEQLKRLGALVDEKGSWMGTFDRVVMKVSSLVTDLDDKFIPSLVSGERIVVAHYDKAIAASAPGNAEYAVLVAQRDALQRAIDEMAARVRKSA